MRNISKVLLGLGCGALIVVGLGYYYLRPISAFPQHCAFCTESVLEAQTFYRGTLVSALYTHQPTTPGHCLIIPNRHVERFEALSSEEVVEMLDVIKKVNLAVRDVFGTVSYFLLQKNGIEAGQTVPHAHFHYIPQKQQEGSVIQFAYRMIVANAKSPIKKEEMQSIVDRLKEAMQRIDSNNLLREIHDPDKRDQ